MLHETGMTILARWKTGKQVCCKRVVYSKLTEIYGDVTKILFMYTAIPLARTCTNPESIHSF